MVEHYDVIVIGSGAGLNIARAAVGRGMKTALVEREATGGTCLNRGCIPSKMLLYPAEIITAAKRGERLNITPSEKATIIFSDLIKRISETVDKQSFEILTAVKSLEHLTFYVEDATFVSDKVLQVGSKTISADTIFIATGAQPHVPDISGLAGTPYMTSREALRRSELPKSMLIIGGGYVAVELGHAYAAAGTEVQLIVRTRLLSKLDADIADEFTESFCVNHTIHLSCVSEEIIWDGDIFAVMCRTADNQIKRLKAEALLVATGIEPHTKSLGLEKIGIDVDADGYIRVNEYLETSAPGVYALGDAVGNYIFRHTANYEAKYLVETVFSNNSKPPLQYGPVPYGIFSHPQIAGVGKKEHELQNEKTAYVLGKAFYRDSTPGMARCSENGFVKILIEKKSRRILGAHIVGEDATTMIHFFIACMKFEATLDDMLDMIFIHPALPEVARDAAFDARSQLD